MSLVGVYRVTGTRAYRGHAPGTEFWATLQPLAEERAIARGNIVVLERLEATLPEGGFSLPDGWTTESGGKA